MTPSRTVNLLRGLFIVFCACIGLMIGDVVISPTAGLITGTTFALAIVLLDRLLHGFTLRVFSSATFGLLLGFIFTQLLLASNILRYQSEEWRWVTTLALYAAFGYLGMMLAMRSNRDEFSLIIPYVRFRQSAVHDAPVLVDTNVIIDGRISRICEAGFLTGSLVVPRFVLDELQRLADSAEPEKRELGRRGLQTLHNMQSSGSLNVTIHEAQPDPGAAVDTQLAQLAKLLNARLLTNDGNLGKIAQLQQVQVLNLNELAKAMHPAFNTGDELDVTLTKEGRDPQQAVAYLGDGTMIVVNHARSRMGQTVRVRVTGALQTTGGRMYFAELK